MNRLRTILSIILLSLLLAGGTATGEMSGSDLNGTYYVVQALGSPDSENLETAYLSLDFDGAGTVVCTKLNSSEGWAEPVVSYPYEVKADGRLIIDGNLLGGVSPSGNYFTFSEIAAPGANPVDPYLAIGIKGSSGLTESDFEGTYYLLSYGKYEGNWFSNRLVLTADGEGSFSVWDLSETLWAYGSYYVDNQTGEVRVEPAGGVSLQFNGVLSSDGSVFSGIDYDTSDNEWYVAGGIKAGSNLELSDIRGKYYFNRFDTYPGESEAWFAELELFADGDFLITEVGNSRGAQPYDPMQGEVSSEGGNQFLARYGEAGSGEYAVFSPQGEIFAMSVDYGDGTHTYLLLGTARTETDNGSDSDSDSGCFIRSLFK